MTTNIKKIILFTLGLLASSYLFTRFYESRLFLWETRKKWGQNELQVEKFKQGSYKTKASMAYSAVKQQYGHGWKKEEIIKQLGPSHIKDDQFSRWYKKAIGYRLERRQPNSWNLMFYYNNQGVVTAVKIERQILGDTVFSAVAYGLLAPVLILYFMADRVLAAWQ